jgi:hypothetical protein
MLDMRYLTYTATVAFVIGVGTAEAQYPLQSADGKSGLLAKDSAGVLTYESSENRIGVVVDRGFLGTSTIGANGAPTIPDLTEMIFSAGFSATKGKRDLFAGGAVTPGVDLGLTVAHTIEKSGPGYHQFYGRVRADWASRKIIVSMPPVDGTSAPRFERRSPSGVDLGVAGGYNAGLTEDFVLGFGVIVERRWNSAKGLDVRQVCVEQLQGTLATGDPVRVSQCDERVVGPLRDGSAMQLRADLAHRFAAVGTEGAAVGILASASVDLAKQRRASYSFTVGPSLHRPKHPQQVVFAFLLEGVDVGNGLGNAPGWSERIRVRAYVGVPFEVLK